MEPNNQHYYTRSPDVDLKIMTYVNLIQIFEKEDNNQMAMQYSLKALKLAEENNSTTGFYNIYNYK